MQTKPNTHYFLITLLLLSLLLIYFITQPFLGALLLAAIFSYLFQPIYQKIKKWNKVGESGSAFITTILSIAVVIAPLIFLGIQIFNESTSLYRSLIANSGAGIIGLIEQTINQFQSNLPIETKFEFNVSEYIKQTLDIVIQNLGSLFTSLAQIILNTFVFLTAFYFFLKDGNKLKSYIIELSPLTLKENNLILSRLATSVSAAVKGNVIIGIIQGILTGIGFALFGVPNAVLWGGVAAIAAFIPGIGTALVITPGILFLFLTGNTFEGIGLLL
jgi:predicted PurR-regulated permease PerM